MPRQFCLFRLSSGQDLTTLVGNSRVTGAGHCGLQFGHVSMSLPASRLSGVAEERDDTVD